MHITNRERGLLITIAVFTLLWAGYSFGLKPVAERIETLNRVIPDNEKKLQELNIKSRQYINLSALLPNNDVPGQKDFNLAAFLESVYTDSGLPNQNVTIKQNMYALDSKYSQMVVEIRFENISLRQLIDFVLKTGIPKQPLYIKSFYVTSDESNSNSIDACVEFSCLKLNPA